MGNLHSPSIKGSRMVPSRRLGDEDGFDGDLDHGVIRLLEENARLRALVTQLSALVLKHVADQK
ncbi:MAG: hypothetical protein JO141_18955 [Bradyrhizobium sp.]|nr:hypothetical protein [Bradyrhizobium sp.]